MTFFSNHLLTQEYLFPFVMNTCVKNQIFEIMKLQISMLLMAGESIREYQSPRSQLYPYTTIMRHWQFSLKIILAQPLPLMDPVLWYILQRYACTK